MNPAKTLLLPIVLGAALGPARAQSLEVIGYSGYLGEWELSATVTKAASGQAPEFGGPLTMRHVGICTVEGPEERRGELHLRLSPSSSRMDATLLLDGVACTFSARPVQATYAGTLSCPDRDAVPLRLWVKAETVGTGGRAGSGGRAATAATATTATPHP